MVRWNQQIIVYEETIQEVDLQQDYHVDANSEALVALPEIVLPNALLVLLSEVVVEDQARFMYDPETEGDRRNIGKHNVHQKVVPPALPEVRQYVLPRQLDHLVQNVLEMQNVEVADHERGQEPIAEVHAVVMVEVIPNVGHGQLAIVVIRVMARGDFLV